MDNDTKSVLMNIVTIVIAGGIIYYLFYKPAIQLQQSNQLQLQQYQQQYQMRQQEYQQPRLEQSQLGNSYKNNEKWIIARNKDGFISNIEVIRDAKVS